MLVTRLLCVGERVCDVAFWKEELLAEIQRMEGECDNLGVRPILHLIFTTRRYAGTDACTPVLCQNG